MAVAVKNSVEAATRRPVVSSLAGASMAGVCYVIGGLAFVFYGIPALWDLTVGRAFTGPVSVALEILVMIGAAIGLVVVGANLVGSNPPRGWRAGTVLGIAEAILILLVTCSIGGALEQSMGPESMAGAVITLVIALALGVGAVVLFLRPGFDRLLVQIEDQGWFSGVAYKRSQGQRVRRGTILGILLLAGCGIYTLLHHNTLALGPRDWTVVLPFTGGRYIMLLPNAWITLPLVLSGLTLWLAYRVVNLPVFADFLIATEAELNKVSWTTRRRLIQDTIVVLVLVFVLTVFLFVVDQAWGFLLTRIGVLQIGPADTQQIAPKEQSW